MKNSARSIIISLLLISIVIISLYAVKSEDEKIIVEYFYGEYCDTCNETKPIIDSIEQYYGDRINISRYSVEDDPETENYQRMVDFYEFEQYPAIVVLNQTSEYYTKMSYEEITVNNLILTIDQYLTGENQENTDNQVDQNIVFNIILILLLIVIILAAVILIIKKNK